MRTHTIRTRLMSAAVTVAALAAACGGTQQEQAPAATAVTSNPVDPATAGTIAGSITLQGTPPAPAPIRMDTDPACSKQSGPKAQPTFLVGSGGALQNVFVYVKDGLGNLKFPVPQTPLVLDQKGCMYEPHVFGIQVGQTLDIVNSDATLHNIHAVPANNREFNRGQSLQGMKYQHVFTTAEVMVPFKCDVHNWMHAFVGVVEHPFHAVTGADGMFQLKGLPPGTYTIEAWHEKLGPQSQMVTLGAKETKNIAFTFTIS